MRDLKKESEALVHILTDATAEPIMLSYRFLENITNNFSKDLEIGRGGFGVVYMGIVRNMKVAVKKLSRIDDFSEKQFEDELQCLKRVKHKNIVRFLGYCSDTPKEVVEYKGSYVLAECRKRFLCFEYAPNKSLEDYIKDESRQRDWDTRYHLIKGICRGLHYLHKKERINHLDLKPANILLDADMVPKITDFGLSRRFSGEQSRIITEHVRGTLGYIAPEYIDKGEISFKTDIYSLGIIIRKLLTGRNDDLFDHEGIVCSRAKRCIKMAQLCVDADQKRRPSIDDIIDMLNLMGTLKDNPEFSLEQKTSNSVQLPRMDRGDTHFASKIVCNGTVSKVTDIYSLEFCFALKPNKRVHYPMTLTNVTDHYVGVWIAPIIANSQVNKSLEDPCSFFLMKPNSTWVTTTVTTKEQQRLPSRDNPNFKMTILVMGSSNEISITGSELLKLVKESVGNKLPQVMLSAAIIDNRANCKIVTAHQATSPRTAGDGFCMAMDVHPTEPWIIMGDNGGLVSIWNYQTQQIVKEAFEMTTCGVCSVKFIARDQWFAVAAGDAKGWIRVFNNSCFERKNKVEAFEAHPDKCVDSLAVHPTYPILLSSSCEDSIIKRWDRDQGWACTRVFKGHTSGVRCLAFNPSNTNNFASIDLDDVSQLWDINSSNAITPSPVEPENVDYFFSHRRHRHFLICCDDDQIDTAELGDAQTHDHLQTLGVFMQSKLVKNDVGVKDSDRGNSMEKKSGQGSEIRAPGQIKKASAKNSDAKENHGGRGDPANNANGASRPRGAGNNKGKSQMGSAPTSTPVGYPSSSVPLPSRHKPPPGTATAGNLYMYYNSIIRDDNENLYLFCDENPNSCSVM